MTTSNAAADAASNSLQVSPGTILVCVAIAVTLVGIFCYDKVRNYLDYRKSLRVEYDVEAQTAQTCPIVIEPACPASVLDITDVYRAKDRRAILGSPPLVKCGKVVPSGGRPCNLTPAPTRRVRSASRLRPFLSAPTPAYDPKERDTRAGSMSADLGMGLNTTEVQPLRRTPKLGRNNVAFYRTSVPPPRSSKAMTSMMDDLETTVALWCVADSVVGAHPNSISVRERYLAMADAVNIKVSIPELQVFPSHGVSGGPKIFPGMSQPSTTPVPVTPTVVLTPSSPPKRSVTRAPLVGYLDVNSCLRPVSRPSNRTIKVETPAVDFADGKENDYSMAYDGYF